MKTDTFRFYVYTLFGRLVSVVFVGLMLTAIAVHAQQPSWPQFLGPNRNGISAETGLMDAWPNGGPKEVWRVAGGIGMAGLAIDGERAYTMIQKQGKQLAVAHDSKSGKSIWETPIAPEYKNAMGNGPRATPTIAGNTIFVFTGQGVLAALNKETGKSLWSHDLVVQLQGKPAEYGMACSPLVVDGQVIVTVGAPNATVVSTDAKSGEFLWKAGTDTTGYSSPAMLKIAGSDQVVVCTGNSVLGLSPKGGNVLWRYPFVTDFGCNTATPIAIDGKVLVSSGENHGSVLLSITSQGCGYAVAEAWSSFGRTSVLRSEWQTPVLLDGHLYGMDNVGSAGPVTHLTCVKASTGERVWQKIRFGKSNLIAADGKLFISTMKGELVVAKATTEGYQEIGRTNVIVGKNRQAPVIANGLLYLRDDNDIVCLDIRKK